MRTNKQNALLKTRRNLLRGDAGTDISVRGETVEEVTGFFMEMFSGNTKEENIRRKSKHIIQ